jgi:hypothetical protein
MNAAAMPALDTRVSVLFTDPSGIYPTLVADCWDKTRDARNYDGPLPVVAHPPCELWINLAQVNYKRWGGGHNRPGNDGGCFASALYNVRRWGGVLEHPAGSEAWAAHGLVSPGETIGWRRTALCEWVCEVWQSAYGHLARKRTWLFYCGCRAPLDGDWRRESGTHQCGKFDRLKPTLEGRKSKATPPSFAHWLIDLASGSAS